MGKKQFATDHSWVGSYATNVGVDEKVLCDNRDKVEILAEVSDPNQDYSFDVMAIARFGRNYYVCQAAGCSCPSPSETWGVVHVFKSKRSCMKAIENGEYKGYTLPSYAISDLRKQLLGA